MDTSPDKHSPGEYFRANVDLSINCEYPCDQFVQAIYWARTKEERKLLLSFLTQYFDFLICRGTKNQLILEKSHTLEACLSIYFCLTDPICQQHV